MKKVYMVKCQRDKVNYPFYISFVENDGQSIPIPAKPCEQATEDEQCLRCQAYVTGSLYNDPTLFANEVVVPITRA